MNKQEIEKAISYVQNMDLSVFVDKDEACNVVDMITDLLQQQLTNGWTPVSESLPEENIDGITDDFLPYNVSLKFKYGECVRTYQFGQGRWWKNGDDMTAYVIAWQPLPELWKGDTQ